MQPVNSLEHVFAQLPAMRQYIASQATASYAFRKQKLLQVKEAVLQYEQELHQALYTDLKKSAEESWVTETGFIISEINYTLKRLKKWMQPDRTGTNLLNFPSKSVV